MFGPQAPSSLKKNNIFIAEMVVRDILHKLKNVPFSVMSE